MKNSIKKLKRRLVTNCMQQNKFALQVCLHKISNQEFFNLKLKTIFLMLLFFVNVQVHSTNIGETMSSKEFINLSIIKNNLKPSIIAPKPFINTTVINKIKQYSLLTLFPLSLLILLYKNKTNEKSNNSDNTTIKGLEELLIEEKESNNNLSLKIKDNVLLLAENEKALFSKVFQISTYHETISKVSEDISKIINSDSEIKASQLLFIEKTLLMIINNNDVWENFKYQFEKTRPHFYKKLLAINPNLTITDLKHCSYVMARLSSKEVSNLINTSYRSVETTRYRLKKKLNLKPDSKLYYFLQNL